MINRLRALFGGDEAEEQIPAVEALPLAAAALLVEAACMDGDFDDDERATITNLLTGHFELSAEEIAEILEQAEEAVNNTGQLYAFTRVVKDRFSAEERISMIEMIWEVAYADGRVDHYESNLIRRIAGLLFVSDRDRGVAQKRVRARLGITSPSV